MRTALLAALRRGAKTLSADQVTVYAAQASFFVIISVVPFLSLLIAVFTLLLPSDVLTLLEQYSLSDELLVIVGSVYQDLSAVPHASLLSLSVLATLWSASKGMRAVQMGLEKVYHSDTAPHYVSRLLRSFLATLAFIAFLATVAVLMLFGNFLAGRLELTRFYGVLLRCRVPILLLLMCIVFLAFYITTAKRSHSVRANLRSHLPGAVCASLGWYLFSSVYSLYIQYFPRASYIYGSLAAICLIMLWLYFCMMILLLGAELNKLLLTHRPL